MQKASRSLEVIEEDIEKVENELLDLPKQLKWIKNRLKN